MDQRFIDLYEEELRFVREMGREFAKTHPKIAARLSLDAHEVADPYTERLLEGFAFLTARVRMRMDNEYPLFTDAVLDFLNPVVNAPGPSMAVVAFEPDPAESAVFSGFTIPRGASLIARVAGVETPCRFRLCADANLTPLVVADVGYEEDETAIAEAFRGGDDIVAFVRLRLRVVDERPMSDVDIDQLTLFLHGEDDAPDRLLKALVNDGVAAHVRADRDGAAWTPLPADAVAHAGFTDEEALLPQSPEVFSGYRLLKEFFLMPERTRFARLRGLKPIFAGEEARACEVRIGLRRRAEGLRGRLDATSVRLNCAPAANLFPRRADRAPFRQGASEQQVIVDRMQPSHYEVYAVEAVEGAQRHSDHRLRFAPLYNGNASDADGYYRARREPAFSADAWGSDYRASEVMLGLCDVGGRPPDLDLQHITIDTLCTNRHLASRLRSGCDFTLESQAPVAGAAAIVGPTAPQPAPPPDAGWKLVNALSFNPLTLADAPGKNADQLRRMAQLFARANRPLDRALIDGLLGLAGHRVVRRAPGEGPASLVAGVGLDLALSLENYRGVGWYGFAATLEALLARSASVNAFTALSVFNENQDEIATWPPRTGAGRIA